MNRDQALAHLCAQLDVARHDHPFGRASADVAEVLDWLGESGVRRVIGAAYLADEDGTYWPAFAQPADLWQLVWRTLSEPEPRAVPNCPAWCAEHTTRALHSVLEDDENGTGYTVSHHAQHGQHVSIHLAETAVTENGPTLPDPEGATVSLILDTAAHDLTASQAWHLACELLAAADQLEQLEGHTQRTDTDDTEENPR